MKIRFNNIPECKLPSINSDADFICVKIERSTGIAYSDQDKMHFTFQEIDKLGRKPVFYSLSVRMSTVVQNRSFFDNIKTDKKKFYEIKSIEKFNKNEY